MPKVKLTLFQDPVEVPEDELPSLRQQGLVVEVIADASTDVTAKAAKTTPRKDEQ